LNATGSIGDEDVEIRKGHPLSFLCGVSLR